MIQEIRKQMEAIVYIIATNSSWRFFSLEYLIQNTIESPARIENSASIGTRENTMASINEAIAIRQTATSQPVCIADLDISKSATSIPFISFRLFSSISSFVIITSSCQVYLVWSYTIFAKYTCQHYIRLWCFSKESASFIRHYFLHLILFGLRKSFQKTIVR